VFNIDEMTSLTLSFDPRSNPFLPQFLIKVPAVHALYLTRCNPLAVIFTALLVPLLVSGCGNGRPKLVKVNGVVKLDGQPVEGAMVVFQKAGDGKDSFQRPSSGITDSEGKFTVRTYEPGDGLPYGKYLVGIQKRQVVGKPPVNPGEESSAAVNITYKWVIPKSYSEPAGSTLTAEVTSSGLTPAEFALSTGGKPAQIEIVGPRARANDP
jgi:hypothetical protein